MVLSLRYRLLCGLLRILVRCGVDERDLETAVLRYQLKILRRSGARPRFTTADRAFLAAAALLLSRDRWSSFLVRPDTLVRWNRELLRRPRQPSRRPRPPSARFVDQGADPSLRTGKPQVGLPQNQRRVAEARGRRLRDDHRHRASSRRPRPGAPPDRPHLDAVPQAADLRPAVLPRPIRRGAQPAGPRIGSEGGTGPEQRRPNCHRSPRTHPRGVVGTAEPTARHHLGCSAADTTCDSGPTASGDGNSRSRRTRGSCLNAGMSREPAATSPRS